VREVHRPETGPFGLLEMVVQRLRSAWRLKVCRKSNRNPSFPSDDQFVGVCSILLLETMNIQSSPRAQVPNMHQQID